ncbi:hypothetical protein [Negativicoccus succinicivorans]|uniref:hypothetical protein n=1 Tax=Negativicoccus succinicivorans TaxID=620903 RepID=UPI002910943F|nr:hypothetical protein [Negativicoccus succinicivorans]MDU5288438.1 hypothetical protein [Negativicoccus succinicivorans]MDU6871624.1 hypothetical protein [Negativicoccus succinicivorans]
MRKVAWLLSGLLALTTAAYAATPIAVPPMGTLQWPDTITAASLADGFMDSQKGSVAQEPMAAVDENLTPTEGWFVYQLQAERPEGLATAWLVSFAVPMDDPAELEPFFRSSLGDEERAALAHFNVMLYGLEAKLNQKIAAHWESMVEDNPQLRGANAMQKQPPLYVRIREIDSLVPVTQAHEVMYRVGARLAPEIDGGWVLPYYAQCYIVRRDDQLAGVLLLVSDTDREYFARCLAKAVLTL